MFNVVTLLSIGSSDEARVVAEVSCSYTDNSLEVNVVAEVRCSYGSVRRLSSVYVKCFSLGDNVYPELC